MIMMLIGACRYKEGNAAPKESVCSEIFNPALPGLLSEGGRFSHRLTSLLLLLRNEGLAMIEKYSPEGYENYHTVQITFNKDGYIGHIAFHIGGNCLGSEILETGLNFLDDCDEDNISNLVKNDCKFKIHLDDSDDGWEPWFSIELSNPKYVWGEDVLIYDDIEPGDLKNLIVCVEITECIPE